MIKQLLSLIMMIASFNAMAQTEEGFTKAEEGMEYKIFSDGKNDLLKNGEFMELHFTSIIKGRNIDSVLTSTRDIGAPQIMPLDSTNLPPAYYKIFAQLRNGDSVSTRTATDSIIDKQPIGQALPPFIKKGMFIYTNIKIVNIYKTQEEADKARQANMAIQEAIAKEKEAAQIIIDDKILSEYLAANKITATKSPKGSYVQITKLGVGAKLNNTQFVKVKYKGKTLDGNIFDTNMDATKGHTDPLLVNLTNDMSLGGGVIPGMTDALLMMQKGTKGIMYIPSTLGYGARGAGADIGPNANLIFEVEVLSVMSKSQAAIENRIQQNKMMALQKAEQAKQKIAEKKYMDSLQRVDPKAAAEMKRQIIAQRGNLDGESDSPKSNGSKSPAKKSTTPKAIIKPSAIKKTAKKK
jgi:FKBP-type peptidyl-prolyl cis-trans isomerase FkpA